MIFTLYERPDIPKDLLRNAVKEFIDSQTVSYATLSRQTDAILIRDVFGMCESFEEVEGKILIEVRMLTNSRFIDAYKSLSLDISGLVNVQDNFLRVMCLHLKKE